MNYQQDFPLQSSTLPVSFHHINLFFHLSSLHLLLPFLLSTPANLSPLVSFAWPLFPRLTSLSTLSVITFCLFASLHPSPFQPPPPCYLFLPSHPHTLSVCLCSFIWHVSPLCSSPSDQHGSSKPPLSSSAMTSRILLRQQLMREQLQEQERREQQRQQASQYPQTTAAQTPAINVSVPVSLAPAAQVPMEVLKVRDGGSGF